MRAEIDRNGQSANAEYLYDHDGIRVGKILNGIERIEYLVDKNRPYAQVLEERDGMGALRAGYVYGDDLISLHQSGESSYYNYDGLGSSRALTDRTGALTDSYAYEAFGSLVDREGETKNA